MKHARIQLIDSFPIAWSYLSILVTSIHALLLTTFLLVTMNYGMEAYGWPNETFSAVLVISGIFIVGLVYFFAWVVDRLERMMPFQFSLKTLLFTCGYLAAFLPYATMEWSLLTAALVCAQASIVTGLLYLAEGWTARKK